MSRQPSDSRPSGSKDTRPSKSNAKLPSTKLLGHLRPLNQLSEKQLVLLQAHSTIKRYVNGEQILALGSEDRLEYFLLKGRVTLEAFDGRIKHIEAGTESARTAIALLQPRKYKVTADIDSIFLLVSQQTVEALLSELPRDKSATFSARGLESGHEIEDIVQSFESDLKANTLELPSFPDVAIKIKALIDCDDVTAQEVGDAISSDPAITVKLLKTCNSALYPSVNDISSCQEAVVRLGFETTKQLVNIFAMKELFKTDNRQLQVRMRDLWSHSREVATIAYVLAEHTPGMNPEEAMLAGLVHDIGTIPVLEYVQHYPHTMKMEHSIDELIKALKTRIGSELLEGWGFKPALKDVVLNSENWLYESSEAEPDYVDVVVVAQVHALIGKKETEGLPPFDAIPAFKKLGENGLTPEQSQAVLLEAHHRIAELKALLSVD